MTSLWANLRRLIVLTLLYFAIAAQAEPIPVKEAFLPSISTHQNFDGQFRYDITIDFAKHYYLYADKTTISSDGATLSYDATPVTIKTDPYFGDVEVWNTPPTLTINSDIALEQITLRTQGCEEDVICYPPTDWDLELPKSSTNEIKNSTSAPNQPLNALFSKNKNMPVGLQNRAPATITSDDDILDIDQAFITETTPDNRISIDMPAGYYVYQDSITLKESGEDLTAEILFPEAEEHEDPFRGPQAIYRHQFTLTPPTLAHYPATLTLTLQGCAENKICYPPDQRQLMLSAPAAGTELLNVNSAKPMAKADPNQALANKQSSTTATNDGSDITAKLIAYYWTTLPLIFLLGIALSFTACIYPLIPIVTSLVVGKNTSTARSYGLISVYVLAMGAAMAALGAIFGLFEINLQVVLQTPWITALVALFFALLAFSMFDVFTLRAPAWLQTHIDKLNRRQQSGSFVGAAIMGALSVLVVSPCATPVLTALLLFSAQATPIKGALALFVFGVGTGLPLLLFAGALRRFMPRAGTWMNTVKKGFAFALLAIAVWLVARILPHGWALLTWTAYSVLLASFVFPIHSKADERFIRIRFAIASLALIVALIIGQRAANTLLGDPHISTAPTTSTHARFEMVEDSQDITSRIANSDKPVILDFYADWCIECKIWERDIWTNPEFNAPLSEYKLLKVDVTDFNEAHKSLFRQLNLVGPPAVLFYPAHGDFTSPQKRIIGEMAADDFRLILKQYRQ